MSAGDDAGAAAELLARLELELRADLFATHRPAQGEDDSSWLPLCLAVLTVLVALVSTLAAPVLV